MGITEGLKNLIENEPRTVRNIIALLFTFGLEGLIKTADIFVCPEKGNVSYGWMFIFAPAVIMAVISVMLSEDFWKLTKGICYYRSKINRRRKFPCFKPRWNCLNPSLPPPNLWVVLYNAVAAGASWLFWAFLQGRYYMCIKKGNQIYQLQPAELQKPVNQTEINRISKIFDQAKTESQLIGFSIILLVVIVPSFIFSIYRCCYDRSDSSIPDLDKFKEIEAEQAVAAFKEKVDELAKREGRAKVEKFFKEQKQASRNPADMLRDVYSKFKERTGFDASFDGEYDQEAAPFYKTAFGEKQKELAKAEIEGMMKGPVQSGGGDEKCYSAMQLAYDAMVREYPRATGDRGQPNVNVGPDEEEQEMRPLTT